MTEQYHAYAADGATLTRRSGAYAPAAVPLREDLRGGPYCRLTSAARRQTLARDMTIGLRLIGARQGLARGWTAAIRGPAADLVGLTGMSEVSRTGLGRTPFVGRVAPSMLAKRSRNCRLTGQRPFASRATRSAVLALAVGIIVNPTVAFCQEVGGELSNDARELPENFDGVLDRWVLRGCEKSPHQNVFAKLVGIVPKKFANEQVKSGDFNFALRPTGVFGKTISGLRCEGSPQPYGTGAIFGDQSEGDAYEGYCHQIVVALSNIRATQINKALLAHPGLPSALKGRCKVQD